MGIDELIKFLLMPTGQVALIIGLSEIIKRLGLKKKWIPLIDLGFGLLSGIGIYGLMFQKGIVTGIVIGIAFGLSACGLFSGIKNLTEVKS